MSPHNAQEPMDPGDLKRKHRVFLCHSGAQKGFVEQVDKDLRRVNRFPFFDKDRESLPIAENFPNLIFQAIEYCQVGVVFLSEEFFVRSHWPMFEVVSMVKCGRKIMPIFLGISPGDLSNKEKVAEWKSKWEVWAKCKAIIDVPEWESTLRFLRPLNGLVYNDANGVVKFREEIVKEVCKIVPPFRVWDDSHIQGGTRLSKDIEAKIRGIQTAHEGVQVVGLYGIGGIGKTTICKSLCKDLFMEFDGRVCHIEFGVGSSERSKLERVQEVLKRLTYVDNGPLEDKNIDKWSLLQEHLASKGPLSSNKVFLAIDNVSANTHDEVRRYRNLKLDQGSIVMVTARELDELERNNIGNSKCFAMPELVEEEARALFVYYAELDGKEGVDEGVIMEYVNRCYFGKGDGKGSKHYHPLALKVLGNQMVGKSPSEWKSQLGKKDIFNQRREQDDPVFSILKWSFDSLGDKYKMLFMDVALFDDWLGLLSLLRDFAAFNLDFDSRFIPDQRYSWYTIFEWLSIVHGISMDEVKERLNVLKKRALLEELGDGRGQIGMHDLWRKFAIMEIEHGEDKLQWVHEEYVSRGQRHAKSCMSSGGWKKLRRIFIQQSRLGSINFSKCTNVIVLRLINVYVENGALDLSHLESIRTLEIVHLDPDQLLEYRFEDGNSDLEDTLDIQVTGVGQLLNLTALIWLNINDESMSAIEEISCLTNLQILHLKCNYSSNRSNPMSLDLQQLRYLQDVRMEIPSMVSILGFSSRMKSLRSLDLAGCCQLRSCVGVGDVDGLEVLCFDGCSELEELPDLQKLVRLRMLDIDGCKLLKALPGLGCLGTLQVLYGRHACVAMKELPSMSNLAKLEVLDLRGCNELKCILGLGDLVALRELWVYCGWLHGLPDLRNLMRLQNVRIYGSYSKDCKASCRVPGSVLNLALFESISSLKIDGVDHELSNLSKLTALKSLELRDCKFERLPHMGSDMILESLKIVGCGRSRDWDGVWGLGAGPDSLVDTSSDWTLPYLKKIDVEDCSFFELPDLRHFSQLRHLSLYRWGSFDSIPTKLVVHCHVHLENLKITFSTIKELPDLGNFPSLRWFEIRECNNLTNLVISKPLSALWGLELSRCRNLRTVPNTNLFPRLTILLFEECGVRMNEHEVQKLIDRGFDRSLVTGMFCAQRSRDVVLPPANELNCHADEQAAVDAPNDLGAGPSWLEPGTSEFIPYNESLSEVGKIPVPKRALELGSSCANDQEQTKKLKNIDSSSG